MSRILTSSRIIRRLSALALASLVWWALVPGIALAENDHHDRQVGDHSANSDDGDKSDNNGGNNGNNGDDGAGNSTDLVFKARLSPGQEVQNPAVVSNGQGTVTFRVQGSNVNFKLKWDHLTTGAVAGHIHCGAQGANGPVGVTLLATTMGTDGKVKGSFSAPDPNNGCGWQNLAAVVSAMLSGNTYVNVHTTKYPGGEIRGQVGAAKLKFETELSPGQEVQTPAVVSTGEGGVTFRVQGATVNFKLKWEGLTTGAVAGHIHCGAKGANGAVGVTLFAAAMGTDGKVNGSFSAPDPNNACGWQNLAAVVSAMLSGNTYVNVHTTKYPGGEIRGQVRRS